MGKAMSSKAIRAAREKERKQRASKKRRIAVRCQHLNYLIVCEGKMTEPNYFKALVESRNSSVITITLEGKGMSTVKLVNEAIRLRGLARDKYDKIWVVFDKDDFKDFNDAIKLASDNKISVAWSNEAFELWYVLHFQYLDTAITRAQYIDVLNKYIGDIIPYFKYKKNSVEFYSILCNYGNQQHAISFAKKLANNYCGTDYSSHVPCTMVFKLVEELNNPEAVLLELNQDGDDN